VTGGGGVQGNDLKASGPANAQGAFAANGSTNPTGWRAEADGGTLDVFVLCAS
jgi:hypothetical protein